MSDTSRRIWQTSLAELAPFYAYWWRDGEWLRSEAIQPDESGVSSVDVPEEPGHYLLKVYGSGGTIHFRQEVFVEANSDPA